MQLISQLNLSFTIDSMTYIDTVDKSDVKENSNQTPVRQDGCFRHTRKSTSEKIILHDWVDTVVRS